MSSMLQLVVTLIAGLVVHAGGECVLPNALDLSGLAPRWDIAPGSSKSEVFPEVLFEVYPEIPTLIRYNDGMIDYLGEDGYDVYVEEFRLFSGMTVGSVNLHVVTDANLLHDIEGYVCPGHGFNTISAIVITGTCLGADSNVLDEDRVSYQLILAYGDNWFGEPMWFDVIIYRDPQGLRSDMYLHTFIDSVPEDTFENFDTFPDDGSIVFDYSVTKIIPVGDCQEALCAWNLVDYNPNTQLIGYKTDQKDNCKFKMLLKHGGVRFALGPHKQPHKFYRFLDFCMAGKDFGQSGQNCKGEKCQDRVFPNSGLLVKKSGKVLAVVEQDEDNPRKFTVKASQLCAGPAGPGYVLTIECRDGEPIATLVMDAEFMVNQSDSTLVGEDLNRRCFLP